MSTRDISLSVRPDTMNREYHKTFSTQLRREMELLIFGHSGRAVLFFPTRMARFYDYENWGIVAALQAPISKGELQLFCVDSIDGESFYNQEIPPSERIKRHLQYEQYILEEVIPLIKQKNQGQYLEVAGCSMGAYHAANIAFRHPSCFQKVVCMSGRYDLTRQTQNFRDLLDGYHNEDVYYNMPRQFIANLEDEDYLEQMRKLDIIIVIGETDPFIADNREFSHILLEKSIPHRFYVWDNYAHKPRYWQQMVKLYL